MPLHSGGIGPTTLLWCYWPSQKILVNATRTKHPAKTIIGLTMPNASRLVISPHSGGRDPVSLLSSTVILPVSKDSNQKVRLDSYVVSPEIVLGRIVGLVLTQACEVSKRRRKRLRKFVIVELHISCVPLSNERREGMQSGIEQKPCEWARTKQRTQLAHTIEYFWNNTRYLVVPQIQQFYHSKQ
jgi:hypothetical protein